MWPSKSAPTSGGAPMCCEHRGNKAPGARHGRVLQLQQQVVKVAWDERVGGGGKGGRRPPGVMEGGNKKEGGG